MQHLLNCLDGVGTRSGVIVVGTANDPSRLDPAILRRPGRFDRLALFPNPPLEMRLEYFRRMCEGAIPNAALQNLAQQTESFSFAQLRESYILAGQFATSRNQEITEADLAGSIQFLKFESASVGGRADGRAVGFNQNAASPEGAICRKGSPDRNTL